MKDFGSKLLKYSCYILILFILKFSLFKLYFLDDKKRPLNGAKVIFIGDSHIERGIKPLKGEINLAKSAEPLFFSLKRLQLLDTIGKNTTVVIGVSNLIFDAERLFKDDAIHTLLKRWFLFLDLKEHIDIFLANPNAWIAAFLAVDFEFVNNPMNESGFAPFVFNDSFHQPSNSKHPQLSVNLSDNLNLKQLFNTLDKLNNDKIVLFRTPVYLEKGENINFVELENLKKLSNKNKRDLRILDSYHTINLEKKYFHDWDHLNGRGADTLRKILTSF